MQQFVRVHHSTVIILAYFTHSSSVQSRWELTVVNKEWKNVSRAAQFLFSFISAGDIYSYEFVRAIASVCHDRTSEPTASEIKIHINLSFERNTIA